MKSIKLLALSFIASITFFSCSDDKKPEKETEEEVITTVIVTLKNGNETVVLKSYDADGEGPGKPVNTPLVSKLNKNTTYTGSIKLLNETENPAENVTEEVEEEALNHQFFYNSNIGTFTYKDTDSNGNPIGIKFELKTNDASGTGTVSFKLIHEPNKTATGVKGGDVTNAGGSTDVDVAFNVTIK